MRRDAIGIAISPMSSPPQSEKQEHLLCSISLSDESAGSHTCSGAIYIKSLCAPFGSPVGFLTPGRFLYAKRPVLRLGVRWRISPVLSKAHTIT